MPYDPNIHHRRSIRLQEYDYRTPNAYFVTLVSLDRDCLFGQIRDGCVSLSPFGKIVAGAWQWLGQQYSYVELDEWVVMPNHLHAILWLAESGFGSKGSQTTPTKPLGRLIGAFKTVSTREINLQRGTPGIGLWQRDFYEHIIRSLRSLDNIRAYILTNPVQWENDQENPLSKRSGNL